MRAIRTKYHGPSGTRGSRFSARCDAGSVIVGYDYGLSVTENHKAAAAALLRKLGWHGNDVAMVSGALHDGTFAHVFVDGQWEVK